MTLNKKQLSVKLDVPALENVDDRLYWYSENGSAFSSLKYIESSQNEHFIPDSDEGVIYLKDFVSKNTNFLLATPGLRYTADWDHFIDFDSLEIDQIFQVQTDASGIRLSAEENKTINGKPYIDLIPYEIATLTKDSQTNISKLTAGNRVSNTRIISSTKEGNLSSVLYKDDFIYINWNGQYRQPTVYLRLNKGWTQAAFHIEKLDGYRLSTRTSNSAHRRMTGVISLPIGTQAFISRTGLRVSSYDLELFGSYLSFSITNTLYDSNIPSYRAVITSGTVDHIAYTIEVINSNA